MHEINNFSDAQMVGEIITSTDSVKPNATLHGRDFLVEEHGLGLENIVFSDPFSNRGISLHRGLNKDSGLFYWDIKMAPIIDRQSGDILRSIVRESSGSFSDRSRLSTIIANNIPTLHIGNFSKEVRVGPVSQEVKIEVSDKIKYTDKFGTVEYPIDTENNDHFLVIELEVDSNSFLPREVEDRRKYAISSHLRLKSGESEAWKKMLATVIQNGTVTALMIRSIANITFSIQKIEDNALI